jgi:hypothetical protein
MRALTWLMLSFAVVTAWWMLAWGAHGLLLHLDAIPLAGWAGAAFDLALDLALAVLTVVWTLGTLAMVIVTAWAIRYGRVPRWRRSPASA